MSQPKICVVGGSNVDLVAKLGEGTTEAVRRACDIAAISVTGLGTQVSFPRAERSGTS